MKTHQAALKPNDRSGRPTKTLAWHSAKLVAYRRLEKTGTIQRKLAEQGHRKKEKDSAKLLRDSYQLQKRLRHLLHQMMSEQEAARKSISRELRDEVAQTLLGINVRLVTLKMAAQGDIANLKKEIANTQRLVKDSLRSINRFARELDLHQLA